MMDEFKVEKNIPIPKYSREHKYPWDEMDVGDSFYVSQESAAGARASASSRAKDGHGKYASRTVEDGCRIWRIE